MTVASNRGLRKGARTLIQTIAGGGLTALVTLIAGGLPPASSAVLMAVFTALTALIQNWLETGGMIPVLLPTPGLLAHATGGLAEGTVEAVVATSGAVVGDVVDIAGRVVGDVTGQITDREDT